MPDGVGATAIGVAAVRAHESTRPDRLFDDPYASRFLAATGWTPPTRADGRTRLAGVVLTIPIRTRFLDEALTDAADAGCRQVVLLGAGLDTRAFRMDWPPGLKLFEVDLPDMVAFKESVLADDTPACARSVVVADLTEDWTTPLLAAGFDRTAPTVWVAEGLLVYLTSEQNEALIAEVSALSAPGSHLALTVLNQSRLGEIKERLLDNAIVDLWQSGTPDDPIAWLASHGWQATVHDPVERAAAYGRPYLFDHLPHGPGRGFVTATRHEGRPH